MDKPNPKGRPQQATGEGDVSAEIERLVSAVKRAPQRWRVVLGVGVVGTLGAGVLMTQLPAKYDSDTVIVYREGIRAGETDKSSDRLRNLSGTVKEVLLSATVLQPVVREFNIRPDLWDGDDVTDAISDLRDVVSFDKRTEDTFAIKYTGSTPDEAKNVVERLAENVGKELIRVNHEQARSKFDFMEAERTQRAVDLHDLEAQRAAFLVLHPEFAEDTQSQQMPGSIIRTAADKAKEGGTGGVTIDKNLEKEMQTRKQMAEQELGKSRQVVTDKERALAELLEKFTDKHPEVRAARDAVRVAHAELAAKEAASEEAGARLASVQKGQPVPAAPGKEDPYLDPQKTAAAATADPNQADGGSPIADQEMVDAETQWATLNRDVTEARKRFESVGEETFLAKLKIESSKAGYDGGFEVVNPAFLPTEAKQPTPQVLGVGMVGASWLVGAFLAVALAVIDGRLFQGGDLVRFVELLAAVPVREKVKRSRFPRLSSAFASLISLPKRAFRRIAGPAAARGPARER